MWLLSYLKEVLLLGVDTRPCGVNAYGKRSWVIRSKNSWTVHLCWWWPLVDQTGQQVTGQCWYWSSGHYKHQSAPLDCFLSEIYWDIFRRKDNKDLKKTKPYAFVLITVDIVLHKDSFIKLCSSWHIRSESHIWASGLFFACDLLDIYLKE